MPEIEPPIFETSSINLEQQVSKIEQPHPITSINPDFEQKGQVPNPARRRFLGLSGAIVAGAAVASLVPEQARAEITPEEQEFKNIKEDVLYSYGFDIESGYGEVNIESIRQIKDALSIFPRNFASMIQHTLNPAVIGIEHTTPEMDLFSSLKIKFVDFSKTNLPDNEGLSTIGTGTIAIDINCPDIKKFMYHEISHFAHIAVGGPVVSSVNFYRGDSWKDISEKTAVNNSFSRTYGTNDTGDDFSTWGERVFGERKITGIDFDKEVPANMDAEAILKTELVKEAFAILTHGKMDKQYFADLAEDKVNLDYMDHKIPSEFWKLEGKDRTSIYITDLDKKDPAKHLPALITAVQKPEGSFVIPEKTEMSEFGTKIGGKTVSLEPLAESNIIELVIDDFRQPFLIPENGTETFVSINTPAVKMEVVIANNNGKIVFKGGTVSNRSEYSVEKDDYSSEDLTMLYSLSNYELSIIGGILLANGAAVTGAAKITDSIVKRNTNLSPTRRGFVKTIAGFGAALGITGIELATLKDTDFGKGVSSKVDMIKKLSLKSFNEFCRAPAFTTKWGEKKLVEF